MTKQVVAEAAVLACETRNLVETVGLLEFKARQVGKTSDKVIQALASAGTMMAAEMNMLQDLVGSGRWRGLNLATLARAGPLAKRG
ncbi:hypothetical protein [Variovorax sp. LjRoot178]|uniref:hypothetical protein n=1 Tax=Variovorax sp. LjRoot178 TaxID=3342277 RepID=UPI003ECDC5EB